MCRQGLTEEPGYREILFVLLLLLLFFFVMIDDLFRKVPVFFFWMRKYLSPPRRGLMETPQCRTGATQHSPHLKSSIIVFQGEKKK